PFKPPPPGQAPPKRAPKTVQSPVFGLELGKTAPLDDDSIARALAAVLPFPVALPQLTVRQYASLCVELSMWPGRAEEIRTRSGVRGDTARAALDALWGRERAARPEVGAAFEEDCARYREWLRTNAR